MKAIAAIEELIPRCAPVATVSASQRDAIKSKRTEPYPAAT